MAHPKTSLEWERLTPTLALISVVLLASWMGAVGGGYFEGQWALAAFIVAALALMVSVDGALRGTGSRWSAVAFGLFAAYTAWTFASLLWSPNQGDAWLGAGQTLLYLLVFWSAVSLVSSGASRRWVLAASALGPATVAALTLPALLSHIDELFDFDVSRFTGSVDYHNGEAAFLLIPFWVSIYLAGSRRLNPIVRGLALAGAVLSVELAVLTQSRGAAVGMAVSLPVFFLVSGQRLRGLFAFIPVCGALLIAFPDLNAVYLASLNQESAAATTEAVLPTVGLSAAGAGLYGALWGLIERWWLPPKSVTRIVGSVALAGIVVVLIFGAAAADKSVGNPISWGEQWWEAFKNDQVTGQNDEVTGQGDSRYLTTNDTGRYVLWQVAWEDFASHPLLGVGTQNYEATYYQLRDRDASYTRQPHSLPLEVLSERGAVGGILFFGFLASCLGAGLWERFRHLSSEGKGQVGAIAAAITYWFVHASLDWLWQLPAVTLLAALYLAMLTAPWKRIEDDAPRRWPWRAVGAGVALLTVGAVAPLYAADYYLAQSYAADDAEDALTAAKSAQRFNPVSPELPQREAELAMQMNDWDRAEGAYREAIRLNPEHYAQYMLLAQYYQERGDLGQAFSFYEKALALNPQDNNLKAREFDLKVHMTELLARTPPQQSVPVRFMSGGTELGHLNVTRANSVPELERGLQESRTLSPDAGVLFSWPAATIDPFWVENATAPLDVALVDVQGIITEIRSTDQPNEPIYPQQPYRLAIEANLGFFEANSIPPGSQVVSLVTYS